MAYKGTHCHAKQYASNDKWGGKKGNVPRVAYLVKMEQMGHYAQYIYAEWNIYQQIGSTLS